MNRSLTIRKLRIYAILMRLREIEEERVIDLVKEEQHKIVQTATSALELMIIKEVKHYDSFIEKQSSIPHKHRKKRKFHN